MERRMTLRDGKELAGTSEMIDEGENPGVQTSEELGLGAGDFTVQYAEQGGNRGNESDGSMSEREEFDNTVRDLEELGEEESRAGILVGQDRMEGNGSDNQMQNFMQTLIQKLEQNLRMDMNQNKAELRDNMNRKFENIEKQMEEIGRINQDMQDEDMGVRHDSSEVNKDPEQQNINPKTEILEENDVGLIQWHEKVEVFESLDTEKGEEVQQYSVQMVIEENLCRGDRQLKRKCNPRMKCISFQEKKDLEKMQQEVNVSEEIIRNGYQFTLREVNFAIFTMVIYTKDEMSFTRVSYYTEDVMREGILSRVYNILRKVFIHKMYNINEYFEDPVDVVELGVWSSDGRWMVQLCWSCKKKVKIKL